MQLYFRDLVFDLGLDLRLNFISKIDLDYDCKIVRERILTLSILHFMLKINLELSL